MDKTDIIILTCWILSLVIIYYFPDSNDSDNSDDN